MPKWLTAAIIVTVAIIAGVAAAVAPLPGLNAPAAAMSSPSSMSARAPLSPVPPATLSPPVSIVDAGRPESNIWAGDYAGPSACEPCHTERWQQWRGHPHSTIPWPNPSSARSKSQVFLHVPPNSRGLGRPAVRRSYRW